jgi:hypothetical protein
MPDVSSGGTRRANGTVGCTSAPALHAEIKAQGYRGCYGTVRDYVQPFRELGAAPPARPAPPKVRDVAGWLPR